MPSTKAKDANRRFIQRIERRASRPDAVLGPCIAAYRGRFVGQQYEPAQLLDNLTQWLLGAREQTEALIRANMEARWADDPERIPASVANSLRRSAGTNYEALVSYALARFLFETDSAWYLQHPVPVELREALAITFTGRLPVEYTEEDNERDEDTNDRGGVEGENDDGVSPVARVQPDVDILLRNSGWQEQQERAEPVVLLSVKTSLVDRAGMAARWKIYFDLATNPCPHRHLEGCVYERLGISMEKADRYHITHGIVTANIYKYWFHDARYQKGELNSGQTRSNTYMFSLKLTTRDDNLAETPDDWLQFPHIRSVLRRLSEQHGLPC